MKNTRCFCLINKVVVGSDRAMLIGIHFVMLAALAAAPAGRAQIVPVNLTDNALSDSKIPTKAVLHPLPRIEPRKPVADEHKRLFVAMSAGVYAAAGLDMAESMALRPHFQEYDPLARPFVGLPAPGYYAAGALFATGVNWLGWKMARSPRWHKMWWVPQAASIGGNLAGFSYTRAH